MDISRSLEDAASELNANHRLRYGTYLILLFGLTWFSLFLADLNRELKSESARKHEELSELHAVGELAVWQERLDQEEVYCTFRPKDIYESMEDAHVKKDSVMEVLQAIEDYDNIRMIRLRPLRQHEPPSIMKERLLKPEVGGFLGRNYNLAKERKRQAELEAQQTR